MSRITSLSPAILACVAFTACAAPPPPPGEPWQAVIAVPAERPICGWEEVGTARVLRVSDDQARVPPGQSTVNIAPSATLPYEAVQLALKPAEHTLVRVKIVFAGRWLLPTTFPQRSRQPPKPPPEHRQTRIVGHRQITRDVRRPAERFAALRIDGDRVVLFVENAGQGGEDLAVSELRPRLRTLEPRADVFAVTATKTTPWASVQEVALAAACFDRQPGDEPHEVIVD